MSGGGSDSARERLKRLEGTVRDLEAQERAVERLEAITALQQAVGSSDPTTAAWLDRLARRTLARSPLGADPAIMDFYERLMILTTGKLADLERTVRGLPMVGQPACDEDGDERSTATSDGTITTPGPSLGSGDTSPVAEHGAVDSVNSGATDPLRTPQIDSKSKTGRPCRGACQSFRCTYAAEYWRITDAQSGSGPEGRATQEDMASRFSVSERTTQRYISGCPDAITGASRHAPLPWPPPRP